MSPMSISIMVTLRAYHMGQLQPGAGRGPLEEVQFCCGQKDKEKDGNGSEKITRRRWRNTVQRWEDNSADESGKNNDFQRSRRSLLQSLQATTGYGANPLRICGICPCRQHISGRHSRRGGGS